MISTEKIDFHDRINSSYKLLATILGLVIIVIFQFEDIVSSFGKIALAISFYGRELFILIFFLLGLLSLMVFNHGFFKNMILSFQTSNSFQKKKLINFLLVVVLLVMSSFAVIIYQGKMLYEGKKILHREAYKSFLIKAQEHFDIKNYSAALSELENCVLVIQNNRCKYVRDSLIERTEFMSKVEKFIENNALDIDGKLTMLNDLSYISGNDNSLIKFKTNLYSKHKKLSKKYEGALELIVSGQYKEAAKILDSIDSSWTDFGHNRYLYRELNRITVEEIKSFNQINWKGGTVFDGYPYLSALHRLGIKAFLDLLVESSTRTI